MKISQYYLFLFYLIGIHSYAQNFTIEGKVVDTDLRELSGVQIFSIDNKFIATTDLNGNFTINNVEDLSSLKFRFLGTVDEIVEINKNCKYVQLIMFNDSTHCFVSEKKLKRIMERENREKKKMIPKLLEEAISKRIFERDKMCNYQKA